jgi:hypothetical protein
MRFSSVRQPGYLREVRGFAHPLHSEVAFFAAKAMPHDLHYSYNPVIGTPEEKL